MSNSVKRHREKVEGVTERSKQQIPTNIIGHNALLFHTIHIDCMDYMNIIIWMCDSVFVIKYF